MPVRNGDTVPYGLDSIVPTKVATAWGARLIVTQDGYVDFVGDRHGPAGEQPQAIFDVLTDELPVPRLIEIIGDLLRRGEMQTRQARDFVIHDSDQLEVHANTNASAGYCYVTAWLKAWPCGCVPHVTRMRDNALGDPFWCDTEQQGYCNFECPHEEQGT